MNHEKLICYQKSLEIAGDITLNIVKWPRGYGYLSDQIKRAISSIALNISEGNAKLSTKERRRFFRIARASTAEVSACVDLMRIYGLSTESESRRYKSILEEISKMLYFLK